MGTDHLSSRERQIMDALLILGEATAREIQEVLPAPLANATVRTILRILETKGGGPAPRRWAALRLSSREITEVDGEHRHETHGRCLLPRVRHANSQRALTNARYEDE